MDTSSQEDDVYRMVRMRQVQHKHVTQIGAVRREVNMDATLRGAGPEIFAPSGDRIEEELPPRPRKKNWGAIIFWLAVVVGAIVAFAVYVWEEGWPSFLTVPSFTVSDTERKAVEASNRAAEQTRTLREGVTAAQNEARAAKAAEQAALRRAEAAERERDAVTTQATQQTARLQKDLDGARAQIAQLERNRTNPDPQLQRNLTAAQAKIVQLERDLAAARARPQVATNSPPSPPQGGRRPTPIAPPPQSANVPSGPATAAPALPPSGGMSAAEMGQLQALLTKRAGVVLGTQGPPGATYGGHQEHPGTSVEKPCIDGYKPIKTGKDPETGRDFIRCYREGPQSPRVQ